MRFRVEIRENSNSQVTLTWSGWCREVLGALLLHGNVLRTGHANSEVCIADLNEEARDEPDKFLR